MEQRNVIIQIPVKEHTVDYNRLIEYLNKTYCRKYSIIQQTETNPHVMGRSELLLAFAEWWNEKHKNWLQHIDETEVTDFLGKQ